MKKEDKMYIKKFSDREVILKSSSGKIKVLRCEKPNKFDYEHIKRIWEDND